MRIARGIYVLLQHLLPASLRAEHGEAMRAAFDDAYSAARRSGRGRAVRLLLREMWDLARTGLSLRRASWRSQRVAAVPSTGGTGIGVLMDDVRHAARATVRQRGFFALAAVTLALGVGASTAMYSALRDVVLQPLPFPGAERLVTLWRTFGDAATQARLGLEPEHVETLRGDTAIFTGVESYASGAVTLTGMGEPERIAALRVTPGVPRLMGVAPRLGRGFTADEAAGDGARVVMLSYGFWRARFGGRADALGATLHLNGEPWTVVGVMPRSAVRPDGGAQPVDVWLPLGEEEAFRSVLARLAAGVHVDVAAARVEAVVRGSGNGALGGTALPLRQPGPLHDHLRILMVAVLLLLIVACVNVSNLLLHRATARGTESAVRAALGASRARLFRQSALESMILAAAAAVLGLVFAHGLLRALLALRPEQLVALRNVHIDHGVLLFCLSVSALAGLAFGVLPAVRAAGAGATAALGRGGRGVLGGSARLRWTLVGAQVALTFALLIGAALVVASLRELTARDPGFQADGLIAVDVRLPAWRYGSPAERRPVLDAMVEAVGSLPRVETATLATSVPPRIAVGMFGHVEVEGAARESEPTAFHAVRAAPALLPLLGQPLVAGRYFTPDDEVGTENPVILTQAAAARLFAGVDAVGRRFSIEGPPAYTVVGVVRDIRGTGHTSERPESYLYFPLARGAAQQMAIVARARTIDAQLLLDVRQTIRSAEPDAVIEVATVRELFAATLARERFTATLLSSFAAIALALAAIGLYGVLSQVVVARTREIGLRMALGADAARIGLLVLRTGLLPALAGLAGGACIAAAGIRLLRAEVFGLAQHQPAAYGTAAIVLSAAALAAMIVPALRAARMDPVRAIAVE